MSEASEAHATCDPNIRHILIISRFSGLRSSPERLGIPGHKSDQFKGMDHVNREIPEGNGGIVLASPSSVVLYLLSAQVATVDPPTVLTSPAKLNPSASVIRQPPTSPDNGKFTTSADTHGIPRIHSFVICISSLETCQQHDIMNAVSSDPMGPRQNPWGRATGKRTFDLQR
ncbi:hypothetical protein ACJZ2D_008481 [Fusarium nematophilum]